jgi:CubicO group peptidase (beta-lactamase class C family)
MLMTRRTSLASLLLVTLLGLPLAGASLQTAKPEDVGMSSERLQRINQMIQRHIDAGNISGAVTMVSRKGRIAHFEARGLMDVEAKKAMPKDGIFRLASMTKPVIGVGIMMLVEEGKIRLTDPVSRYIPEFRGLKVAVPVTDRGPAPLLPTNAAPVEPRFYTVPAEREITVRDLLSHTSGLVSGNISTREAQKIQRGPNDTLASYIPRLAAAPLEFQPGSRWAYSPGAGFDTLGRLIEIASGQPLDKFFRDRIFDPLGMKDIYFYPPDNLSARLVPAYRRVEGKLQRQPAPNPKGVYFSGGGGLSSSAEDYIPLGQMLAAGGQLNGKRLLGPRTIEMMGGAHAPDTLPGRQRGESFGLSVRVVTDHVARASALSDGSFGWSGAFGTHFWVDPKEQITAVLMIPNPAPDIQRDFENAVMQAIIE